MASSLFGSLPPVAAAPKGDTADELDERLNDHCSRKRPRIEEHGRKDATRVDGANASTPTIHGADEEDAINTNDHHHKKEEQQDDDDVTVDATTPTAAAPEEDQVTAALHRIHTHISNPKKFLKASQLLRQLISSHYQSTNVVVLAKEKHGHSLFKVLLASMSGVGGGGGDGNAISSRANDPLLAMEYLKLFNAASRLPPELFTSSQRAQLDVYGMYAVVRNQMTSSDDSFAFNRIINGIKQQISDLPLIEGPEQEAEEEAALRGDDDGTRQEQEEWTEVEVVAQRRAALVSCVEGGRGCYGRAWARTSLDMLVEHAAQHSQTRFLPGQRERIEVLVRWVRDQKTARKVGISGGGGGGKDSSSSTAYDKASAAWGKAAMSHRGKVGGGGDNQSETWLG